MIISSHLHFRRYPPIYPNIIPRYYIPDNTIQYYSHYIDFEGPSCIYSNWHTLCWLYNKSHANQCCFVVHHTSSALPPQVWSADPREVRRWNGETWNFAVEKSTLLDGWMSMFCLTKLAQLVRRFQHLEYRNMPFLNPCWWLDCSGENIWWVYCSLCPMSPPKKAPAT